MAVPPFPGISGLASSFQDAPAVDLPVLESLARVLGEARTHSLVAQAMEAFTVHCAEMAVASRDAVNRKAHQIKGTAGTLGLRRIANAAIALEAAIACGCEPRELVIDLDAAVTETREALQEMRVLR